MMYALVDIDHVLSNAAVRDELIAEGDWDAYHAASAHDEAVPGAVMVVNALAHASVGIALLTGRPERWRQLTVSWLIRNGVHVDELLMRPNDDFRPTPQVKISLAEGRFGPDLSDVMVVIDDREDVLNLFAAKGITTMQVRANV